MRRMTLLSCVLLLSTAWAVAQYDPDAPSQSTTTAAPATMAVEGCLELDLDGPIGDYTLIDYGGATYQLTGSTAKLKSHVGETVRVTGVVTPVVNIPGAISEGTRPQPTLSVSSIQRLSGVCSDANNIQ
jgi:hypothetical protein